MYFVFNLDFNRIFGMIAFTIWGLAKCNIKLNLLLSEIFFMYNFILNNLYANKNIGKVPILSLISKYLSFKIIYKSYDFSIDNSK